MLIACVVLVICLLLSAYSVPSGQFSVELYERVLPIYLFFTACVLANFFYQMNNNKSKIILSISILLLGGVALSWSRLLELP